MLKDIVGYAKSKVVKRLVNRKFADNIVSNKIGESTVIGQKSYDTYYSRIKKMANEDKQEEAIKYAIEEGNKVKKDKSPVRKMENNTWFGR